MIKGREPSDKKTMNVRLTEREWVWMLDILSKSMHIRSGTLYQKVGNQVIL